MAEHRRKAKVKDEGLEWLLLAIRWPLRRNWRKTAHSGHWKIDGPPAVNTILLYYSALREVILTQIWPIYGFRGQRPPAGDRSGNLFFQPSVWHSWQRAGWDVLYACLPYSFPLLTFLLLSLFSFHWSWKHTYSNTRLQGSSKESNQEWMVSTGPALSHNHAHTHTHRHSTVYLFYSLPSFSFFSRFLLLSLSHFFFPSPCHPWGPSRH